MTDNSSKKVLKMLVHDALGRTKKSRQVYLSGGYPSTKTDIPPIHLDGKAWVGDVRVPFEMGAADSQGGHEVVVCEVGPCNGIDALLALSHSRHLHPKTLTLMENHPDAQTGRLAS